MAIFWLDLLRKPIILVGIAGILHFILYFVGKRLPAKKHRFLVATAIGATIVILEFIFEIVAFPENPNGAVILGAIVGAFFLSVFFGLFFLPALKGVKWISWASFVVYSMLIVVTWVLLNYDFLQQFI